MKNEYNEHAKKLIGTTKTMNCGLKATIIAYRKSSDIDIRFENGTIRKHVAMNNFNKCQISETPRPNGKNYICQTKTMHCGLKATVIAYRGCNDIDVRFENGTIRKHVTTSSFNYHEIAEISQNTDVISENQNTIKTLSHDNDNHIGQSKIMTNGLKATIIAYRKASDIDIQFETGSIRKHVLLSNFNKGRVKEFPQSAQENYIGQTRMMNCGLNATVIAYRNSNDADVQFENGTVRKHIQIHSFLKGEIAETPAPPDNEVMNQTRIMNNGLRATIINCIDRRNMDIQFEDGTVRKHIQFKSFKNGNVAHPNKNILFNTYKLNKAAFVFHNKTYFYVTYIENNSEISDIMCVDDMKQKLPLLTNPNPQI